MNKILYILSSTYTDHQFDCLTNEVAIFDNIEVPTRLAEFYNSYFKLEMEASKTFKYSNDKPWDELFIEEFGGQSDISSIIEKPNGDLTIEYNDCPVEEIAKYKALYDDYEAKYISMVTPLWIQHLKEFPWSNEEAKQALIFKNQTDLGHRPDYEYTFKVYSRRFVEDGSNISNTELLNLIGFYGRKDWTQNPKSTKKDKAKPIIF